MKRYIVAITGASGVAYGLSLCRELITRGYEVHLVVSDPAWRVFEQELGWIWDRPGDEVLRQHLPAGSLFIYNNADIAAVIASGSFITEAMVIIPCSMSTLAAVAHGLSNNLIERTADVMLKEKRPLILVPRETPLNAIHLRNMLSLAEMGVAIVPAMPGFYNHPLSVDDMISFMVGKVMDVMKIPDNNYQRYSRIKGSEYDK